MAPGVVEGGKVPGGSPRAEEEFGSYYLCVKGALIRFTPGSEVLSFCFQSSLWWLRRERTSG